MKIKIYTIARISKDAHEWTNKILAQIDPSKAIVFKPHEHNPWNLKHEKIEKRVYETDLYEIKRSHMGICLPEFGNDCSWECGWYSNSNKPLIALVDSQIKWLRDWMVKRGLDYVVTINSKTYKKLKNDPILKYKKIYLITERTTLTKVIMKIYSKHFK